MACVTLLGSGNMGTAVGQHLVSLGEVVHVWNRTRARTKPLEDAGAIVHADPGTALAASDVVILLVADQLTAADILCEHADSLRNRDVIDLMTGGGAGAKRLASVVRAADAAYLDGVIANFPAEVGTPDALIYVCGDEGAWARRKAVLTALASAAHYLGPRAGAAAEIDAALAGAFSTVAMGAWMEAVAFLSDQGFDIQSPAIRIDWWIRHLAADMAQAAKEIAARDYRTAEATLAVNAAALTHWRQVFIDRGHRAGIMTAALKNLERAIAAGHANSSWSAQAEVMTAQTTDRPDTSRY